VTKRPARGQRVTRMGLIERFGGYAPGRHGRYAGSKPVW